MKAILVQFIYEANTFCTVTPDIEIFRRDGTWCVGASAVREWAASADSQMTGSLRLLEAAGWETEPVFVALCGSPSGRLSSGCFAEIRTTMQEQICRALPADVIIMHLHGAAAAVDEDDPEGALLEMVRDEIGFRGRLVLSLDLHANFTRRMLEYPDAVTGYRTQPHTDFQATGERAARLAMQPQETVRAVAKIAALIPPSDTTHTGGRFRQILDAARTEEISDAIDDILLLPVQPWLDIAEMGSAVVVTGRGDAPAEAAQRIAKLWYEQRHQWQTGLLTWDVILDRLQHPGAQPWILVNTADATSGGSAGSSAEPLRRLLSHADSLPGEVLLYVVDAAAVAAAREGARTFSLGDPPVEIEMEAQFLGDLRFVTEENYYHGMPFAIGAAAILRHGRITVLVSSEPTFATGPSLYRAAGLDPDRALAVESKSILGWRAQFDAVPERGLPFDGPGATSLNFARLSFTGERRNLFLLCVEPPAPIRIWKSAANRWNTR